jgi:high affinity sulfate transporter 1
MSESLKFITDESARVFKQSKDYVVDSVVEIRNECMPSFGTFNDQNRKKLTEQMRKLIHIPYMPAFIRPGWLVNLCINTPLDKMWDAVYGDIFAGFTVGLTIIPQALSYAALAGLPPINGLYSVILPSIVYIFCGSGMLLSVGPVALVSLLMGEIMTRYGIDVATDPNAAVNLAAECCLASGMLMFIFGILNLGDLIRFISYPVISGFTTASAMIIGLNQIKNGFGFPSSAGVPQVGAAVDYNYQVMKWYMENWNGRDSNGYLWRNVHATNITFGIYVPLILLWFFKRNWNPSAEVKKSNGYMVFNFFCSIAMLIALIVAGHEAYLIHNFNDTHHARALKVVGVVPPGLDIFHSRVFAHDFGQVIVDVIPLTIISFMESYAVARKTSAIRGQLWILNASQELFALGVGNMLNSVASGYPVSGSFSRSSLYASTGAQSPLAKTVTLIIVLVALGTLTKAFYFIPQAALSAVVMVAVAGLLDFHEMWVAWKLSKKDFLVMFATFIFTFVFDTEIGLCVGVGLSILVLLRDLAYSIEAKPVSRSMAVNGVGLIRLNSNLVFVSAATIKDTLINEVRRIPLLAVTVVVFNLAIVTLCHRSSRSATTRTASWRPWCWTSWT